VVSRRRLGRPRAGLIDSPRESKSPNLVSSFFLALDLASGGVRPRAFAPLAPPFAAFAPPLGTVSGLPQRRNLRRSDYLGRNFLDQRLPKRFGRAGARMQVLVRLRL
jgi:hypothetical protein